MSSPAANSSPVDSPIQTAPAVSVLVATRDRPETLRRAVTAILGQDYPGPIECVVVFDQSQPEPVDVPTGPDRVLRLLPNTRTPGLAGARNTGIDAASGELIGFCDDDDEWVQGKLAAQVELLRHNPQARAVGCAVILAQETADRIARAPFAEVSFRDLIRSRVWELHPSGVLARADAIRDEIGPIDESLPGGYAEDYDFLLRVARLAPIPLEPRPLVRVAWHQQSFFAGRWTTIADALTYLLAKHPEFATDPRGEARVLGQIAFAYAGNGEPGRARSTARHCLRRNWRERRAWLAYAVSLRLISAERVLALAQARGRGI